MAEAVHPAYSGGAVSLRGALPLIHTTMPGKKHDDDLTPT